MRAIRLIVSMTAFAIMASMSGCRGWTSDQPPVHPNPNMDTQIKYKPYRESEFFADKRDMRPSVEGAVARGKLKADDHFYRGLVNDQIAASLPEQVPLTRATLERGRQRYGIYCAPCHAASGAGEGLVGRRIPAMVSLHTDRLQKVPLGYFFFVMTNGYNRMKSYKDKLTEEDRWAVATYIRTLQISQDSEGPWVTKASLGK